MQLTPPDLVPSSFLESNLLLLAKQGFSLEGETPFGKTLWNFGGDSYFFFQEISRQNQIYIKRRVYSVGPKIRRYFCHENSLNYGPFIGFKLIFNLKDYSLTQDDLQVKKRFFNVSSNFEIGYRFLTLGPMTIAAFAGYRFLILGKNAIEAKDIPLPVNGNRYWELARTYANEGQEVVSGDYGFTVGVHF